MSNPIEFNEQLFRSMYPEFSDEAKYPTAVLVMWWDDVGCWISDGGSGGILFGDCTANAMYMLLAHFMRIGKDIATGQQVGFKTGASIDKISVSYLAPPSQDQFSWWLASTPYGTQLAAYLEMKAVGGTSVGGLPERQGFRKATGVFF